MRIGIISPIAWRTPPRHYGPWEQIVSLLTEELCNSAVDVTLFATADSITKAKLHAVCRTGYEEDQNIIPKVWECLHISEVFERADQFDLIHNHFDYLPLSYSKLVKTPLISTIHGFSSPNILPVYKKYNKSSYYISISEADRDPSLDYYATIYHGIDLNSFSYNATPEDYLLFFGRIHPDKGTYEAIQIAKKCNKKLILAGIIQDKSYFEEKVKPFVNDDDICFVGSADPVKRNRLLGNAYALLHPINFEEPFGLSVIESFACGTPVIAFAKGSMYEIITDQKNGFLVTSIEEAISAVDNISKIDRLICRKDAEDRFSAQRMAHEYIQVYKKILDDII
jgi:glycosyltransferase involved in cell wall biosynthesis